MNEPKVKCPNCSTEFKLTEQLAAPLLDTMRLDYENQLAKKEVDFLNREKAIQEQKAALDIAQNSVEAQVAEKMSIERKKIVEIEALNARQSLGLELESISKEAADLKAVLLDRENKLREAQNAQAVLIRKQRELDDAKREIDLTIEKRVQTSLANVHKKARQEAEDGLKLKVREKEQQIYSMQNQIEELRRKAAQGSQQLQGEALELELEKTLTEKFPFDTIMPVPKGEFGGDVIHDVIGNSNIHSGRLLWELKRTKNWWTCRGLIPDT